MRYFMSCLATIAWACWLGGLVALFLFINNLFRVMQADYREVFDVVAPKQFTLSERYSIVIGGLALLMTFGLRLITPRRSITGLLVALMGAATICVGKTLLITPKMLPMIHPGAQPSPEFMRLHGFYMLAGVVEAMILLVAGFFLPAVMAAAATYRGESGAAGRGE